MMEDESIESRIQEAMRSRVQHFRDQADSLTFEGVRRVLEKDLLLDPHALDVHKRYVKQLLEKYLNGTADGDNVSKDSKQNKLEQIKEEDEEDEEIKEEDEKLEQIKEEDEELPKDHKITEDEGKIEDSPVMGLLTGNESANSGKSETQAEAKSDLPSEDMITEAIWKRGAYFRSKSEEITVAGVRRLLEEDLELKKYSLDSFKKLISKQLDEVLTSTEIPEKKPSINSKSKTPRKKGSKSDTDSSNSKSENIEVEEKPKKKRGPKGKLKISEGPKKRKKPTQETKQGRKKKIKLDEEMSDEMKNGQDVDDESSAEKSNSSAEKSVKVQKEVVAPVYGKKVERLKSIIKSCGMTVAPSLYKKAKQVPEDEREAFIIKELQEILSKEGLSTNPNEKEIKEVKRRKERAKELEGIDTSNIVLGSRRRSTFNFVAPPKPKEPIENNDDDSEDTNDDDDDDDDDSEDTINEEGDDQGEDGDVHAAQSEEAHEDTEGSD